MNHQYGAPLAMVLALVGRLSAAQTPADTTIPTRGAAYRTADSIVLERGPCFGTCPEYRVSIARSGDVHFISLHGADSGKTERRHIDANKFSSLMNVVAFAHFFELPDTVKGPYCPYQLSDLPSAQVSLFLPNREKGVYDYMGCLWAPFILRSIEDAIDEDAGTRRWLH